MKRGVWLALSLSVFACKSQSAEMKECLGTCASADAQAAKCSGPEAQKCKEDITATAQECRQLCEEAFK